MKRIMILILAMLVLLSLGSTAMAKRDTQGPCRLCGCQKYDEGYKRSLCVCGHSKGVHMSVEVP